MSEAGFCRKPGLCGDKSIVQAVPGVGSAVGVVRTDLGWWVQPSPPDIDLGWSAEALSHQRCFFCGTLPRGSFAKAWWLHSSQHVLDKSFVVRKKNRKWKSTNGIRLLRAIVL